METIALKSKRFFSVAAWVCCCFLLSQSSASDGDRVLLVLPHPDDETIIGGLLGRFQEPGDEVHAIYLTQGEGGINLLLNVSSEGGGLSPKVVNVDKGAMLSAIRAHELREAAKAYGFRSYRQLEQPDEWDPVNQHARVANWDFERIYRVILETITTLRINIIITPSPDNLLIHNHHRQTGRIVRNLIQHDLPGNTVEAYAFYEPDWYPQGSFPFRGDQIHFPRRAQYAQFQFNGASKHKSQPPGQTPQSFKDEILVPLFPGSSTERLGRVLNRVESACEVFMQMPFVL